MNDSPGPTCEALPPASVGWLAAALAEHDRWLRTVLAARGVERHALDDAMQNIAAAAIRAVDRLRFPEKAAAWLYRLAAVEALQHRRRSGRRRRFVDRFAHSGVAPAVAESADPLAWLLAREEQQLIRQAVAALPRRDAEILLLKYTEDWSYRELAQRLGLSVAAVEARLHRARGRLRTKLAHQLSPSREGSG